jgi:hypothetical protein
MQMTRDVQVCISINQIHSLTGCNVTHLTYINIVFFTPIQIKAGETCFGETSCYYSEDFVPTQTPTLTQTDPPTTRAPSEYKDPANNR